jgi:hypothetical protein
LDLLIDSGFLPYSGNIWVKYKSENKNLTPYLFATTLKSGKVIISRVGGEVILSTSDKSEILQLFRKLSIDELLDE